MHADGVNLPTAADKEGGPWWRGLTGYHWFVLLVAALGWTFDTMDQQLFVLARKPAMTELLTGSGGVPATTVIQEYGGYATSIFLIGWATGGIIFGIFGDLFGRVRTMVLTILLYSLFTGLSALSVGFWDFAFYRFLTGLGVGGEFAVGVALVAEVMPDRARPSALGLLQALSAVGNITAAVIGIGLSYAVEYGWLTSSWRVMFLVGIVPALLALLVFRNLKEPAKWQAVAAQTSLSQRLGGFFSELFREPRWARNALVGMLLASAGVIGLWGIGFFSIDLQRYVFRTHFEAQQMDPKTMDFLIDRWAGWTSVMLNVGAALGIYAFSQVAQYTGRKPAFAVSFVLALLSTAFVFWYLRSFYDIFWMIPIMGFCQLALFGGYAIYFPELFPTRLRSTGTSFCYNVGRFVAAIGPTALGLLTNRVYKGFEAPWPMRYAGVTMCAVFLLGLVVLPFAPETKGKPLPE
jgi:MFS family permease